MSTTLNLATRPFRNRALPWIVVAFFLSVSLVSLVLITRASTRKNSQALAIQTEINTLRQQEQTLTQRAEEVRASLTPEQLQTLDATHQLVDHKRFSWSRLFGDLETALPGKVRVSRISVRDVAVRDGVTVADFELAVFAKAPTAVTDMIAAMDREGIFEARLIQQNLRKGRGETGTEYELYVIYRPRAGAPSPKDQNADIAAVESRSGEAGGGAR